MPDFSATDKRRLAWLLMIVWLAATAFAFWWFQVKDLRPFDVDMSMIIKDKTLAENIQQLVSQTDHTPPARGYILNFWQPDCSCNRFNASHVKRLIENYQSQGFQLLTISRPSKKYSQLQLTQMAKDKFGSAVVIDRDKLFTGHSRIPASPSAAILNRDGNLNYFGPYNDGAFCGVGGTRFVERVADLVINDEQPNIVNTLSYGCYCNWA